MPRKRRRTPFHRRRASDRLSDRAHDEQTETNAPHRSGHVQGQARVFDRGLYEKFFVKISSVSCPRRDVFIFSIFLLDAERWGGPYRFLHPTIARKSWLGVSYVSTFISPALVFRHPKFPAFQTQAFHDSYPFIPSHPPNPPTQCKRRRDRPTHKLCVRHYGYHLPLRSLST